MSLPNGRTSTRRAQESRRSLPEKIVFDCYYCQGPLQLRLPLALTLPQKAAGDFRVAKRKKTRCEEWLRTQHPGQSLSDVVEAANWKDAGKWAFDGYNWAEGNMHAHRQDAPPTP